MTRRESSEELLFLGGNADSIDAFDQAIRGASGVIQQSWRTRKRATVGTTYEDLRGELSKLTLCPEQGVGLEAVLAELAQEVIPHIVAVGHPEYAAHLHSVPMIPALAAEVLISATNQSLDSFDQAPSATVVERLVIEWLNQALGFASGDGIFTSGGTKSNLMGLLLARDEYALRQRGWDVSRQGLPPDASKWRIFCSELSHFSVERSAAILGLGEQAVVRIPADDRGVLVAEALSAAIARERALENQPFALVLTAGTTDLGSIDALAEDAAVAREHGLWVHVDAAAGGALILSERYRQLLDGIALADSVTLDLHKLLFQPISCGVFLTRRPDALGALRREIPYLDPNDGEVEVGPNLVGKSIETTRRFDALKAWVCLRAVGRQRLCALVDQMMSTARESAALIASEPSLELLASPTTSTVLFRWDPASAAVDTRQIDLMNRLLPQRLWRQGGPVVGATKYQGRSALKLTLTNPRCTVDHVRGILRAVCALADQLLRSGAETL